MSAPYRPVTLDDSEQLLAMSYRLRYQTFCLERLFFSSDAYPTQLESDAFDSASVHVGVLNAEDELVGTARIILPTSAGFPLLRHCTLFPDQTVLTDPANRVVEVSRVCLKRRRHHPHEARAAAAPARESIFPRPTVFAPGRVSTDPFAALIKAVYQATKRLHATHWIVAVEKPLRRRIARYGLPFHLAGPEVDYFGPVAPYVLSLAELDQVIQSHEFPALDDVPAGLEPDYSAAPLSHSGA
jgi:N-acyl amino acid synthase of PEP-CTERM/exosortase system